MLHVTMVLEDTVLIADLVDGYSLNEAKPKAYWRVRCQEMLKGTFHEGEMSSEQLAAVLALATAGDDAPAHQLAYVVAEEALKDWPKEVRPIP